MMRLARICFGVALALLIAAPVWAQPGGGAGGGRRGGPGGFMMGARGGVGAVRAILSRLTLTDDEKKATDEVMKEAAPDIEKAQKAAQLTSDQFAKVKEEMQGVDRTDMAKFREAFQAAMKKVRTKEQAEAEAKVTKLTDKLVAAVAAKLGADNKAAFEKAWKARGTFGKDAKGGKDGKGRGRRGKKTEEKQT